jgi:hypothetical protein
VKCDLLKTANAQRRESVAVLQISESSLHGCAATIEVAEPLRVARDAGEHATAESKRQGDLVRLCATERDDGFAAAFLALDSDPSAGPSALSGKRLPIRDSLVARGTDLQLATFGLRALRLWRGHAGLRQ